MSEDNTKWERTTINDLLEMTVKEQRAKRRWGIFFKLIILAYVVLITITIFNARSTSIAAVHTTPYTAMVTLNGAIVPESDASADIIIPLLRKAFESNAKAVMLRINSQGGSPVQSNMIYNEILTLRAKYPDKPIYTVFEDLGASGAYWIACATNEIYADRSSIVGSIGAAISTFGLVDAMDKLGVQRRLYTSGVNKGMLDPFSPISDEQVAMINTEIQIMLGLFIDVVKQGRGDKLRPTTDMFSGRFWLGQEALPLGLIDGFGDHYYVAREIIGAPEIVEYSPKRSFFSQVTKEFTQSLSLTSWLRTAMITDL